MSYAKVLLPIPHGDLFTYLLPNAQPGQWVMAPFGKRELVGVVWEVSNSSDVPANKMKAASAVDSLPSLSEEMRRWINWLGSYSMQPRGLFLDMILPPGKDLPLEDSTITVWKLGTQAPERLTAARQKVLDVLRHTPNLTTTELATQAECSPSVISGLGKQGAIVQVELLKSTATTNPTPYQLSPEQQHASNQLAEAIATGGFSPILLDGVTGSGKTETYLTAAKQALDAGRQVLLLVPEIALTNALTSRCEQRLGIEPTCWHSHISPTKKRQAWRDIAFGRAKLIVGARSALFLPYADLATIIIDEEHDGSYKQEEGVHYHARDVAMMRCNYEKTPIILASATPAIETMTNAQDGHYKTVHLPSRHGTATLPDVSLIDMRNHKLSARHWLSPTAKSAIEHALSRGQQALLFLNRRGYAPLTLCRTCGYRIECPSCSAYLVLHARKGLQCHQCGYHAPLPKTCPECNAEESLVHSGPGVERLLEEAQELFPTAKAEIISSDHINSPTAWEAMIQRIKDGELNLLIGTQIMAKGHHFPGLTCVVVVDGDAGLAGGDLRASERSFQLLHQVAGRAGRGEDKGHVYIQTHQPDHPLMDALKHHDREHYYALEREMRLAMNWPPYGRLAALILSSEDEAMLTRGGQQLASTIPQHPEVMVLGPAPAPIYRLRNKYRTRFLIKSPKKFALQSWLQQWLQASALPNKVDLRIDIDPYSFL